MELSVDEISGIVIGIAGIPVLIALILSLFPTFSNMAYCVAWIIRDCITSPIYDAIHNFVCSCVESHHRREIHKKGGFRN